MKRKTDWRPLVYLLCILVIIMIARQPERNGSDNPEQQTILGEGWSITGERGERNTHVSRIEGTEELIYITYSGKPYIDVYDLSGAFQYAIMLPDARNGVVDIDCWDGSLVAVSKANTVYVFRGRELVECMEYDEAEARGLVPIWNDKESDYLITHTHVTRADGEELFELPPELAENMPKILLSEDQQKVANVLSLIVFAALWLTIVGYGVRKIWRGFREKRNE